MASLSSASYPSTDSLAQKIINLENKVEGYETRLELAEKAGNETKEERYAALITACRNDLTELRKQQNAQAVRGEKWMNGVITAEGGTTEWKYDETRTKFANELRDLEFESIGENILLLPLTTTLDLKEISTPLIVRPRVKVLWEEVLQDIRDNSEKKETTSIVTGNPGIGKTRSMDYLLRLLLLEHELVFYDQREKGVVYVFVPPGVHELDDTYRVYRTENFKGSETWLNDLSDKSPPFYLYNPAHNLYKNGAPLGNLQYHLVIAVSPNPHHVKGWWKSPSNLRKHIMPSWTLNELLLVCLTLFKLTKDAVISRFCRYGGVLRAVVGNTEAYENGLQEGVGALPHDTMEKMLVGVLKGIDSENVHVSSGLYRIEPDGSIGGSMSFASPYTCALVAGRFWKTIAQQGRGSDRRYTKWFELLCMLVLAKGGTFEARRLLSPNSASSNETLELGKSNLVFMEATDNNYINDVDSNDESEEKSSQPTANDEFYKRWASDVAPEGTCILAPRTTNLPVVDCVSVPHPETGPRGFQVTVSGTHPISYGECEKILQTIGKSAKLDLYFVVPTHVAADFKRQNFKGGSDKPSLHERVTQYVIGISVDHVKEFSMLYEQCVSVMLAEHMQNIMCNPLKRPFSDMGTSDSSELDGGASS